MEEATLDVMRHFLFNRTIHFCFCNASTTTRLILCAMRQSYSLNLPVNHSEAEPSLPSHAMKEEGCAMTVRHFLHQHLSRMALRWWLGAPLPILRCLLPQGAYARILLLGSLHAFSNFHIAASRGLCVVCVEALFALIQVP